jgi:hypothetical protein
MVSTFQLCIRLIRAGLIVVLFGGVLNGIVYVANDFDMPVLVSGPEQFMPPSESECMFSGVETYRSHTQTYTDASVNFPYLADRIYIVQPWLHFHRWPRVLRFIPSTVLCLPEGAARASPGDILMWGGMFFILPLLFFMGVLGAASFFRKLRMF